MSQGGPGGPAGTGGGAWEPGAPRPALSVHPHKPRSSRAMPEGPSQPQPWGLGGRGNPWMPLTASSRDQELRGQHMGPSPGPASPVAPRGPVTGGALPGSAAFCLALRLLPWAPAISSELHPSRATLCPLPTAAQPRPASGDAQCRPVCVAEPCVCACMLVSACSHVSVCALACERVLWVHVCPSV